MIWILFIGVRDTTEVLSALQQVVDELEGVDMWLNEQIDHISETQANLRLIEDESGTLETTWQNLNEVQNVVVSQIYCVCIIVVSINIVIVVIIDYNYVVYYYDYDIEYYYYISFYSHFYYRLILMLHCLLKQAISTLILYRRIAKPYFSSSNFNATS